MKPRNIFPFFKSLCSRNNILRNNSSTIAFPIPSIYQTKVNSFKKSIEFNQYYAQLNTAKENYDNEQYGAARRYISVLVKQLENKKINNREFTKLKINAYLMQGEYLSAGGGLEELQAAREGYYKILEIIPTHEEAKEKLLELELKLGITPKGYTLRK